MPAIKPTIEEARLRLRLDDDALIALDTTSAIDQAHAELIELLDRHVYADATALQAAIDAAPALVQAAGVQFEADQLTCEVITDLAAQALFAQAIRRKYNSALQASFRTVGGMVMAPDLISAQLLLVDVRVGANAQAERDSKQAAAEAIAWRHRRLGC